jgi:hypothetical protein
MTKTPEDGRALAVMLARNSIHAMQGELETLKAGRAQYAHDPYGLIAASHVVAVEFATVAAANNYLALTSVLLALTAPANPGKMSELWPTVPAERQPSWVNLIGAEDALRRARVGRCHARRW